MSDIKYEIVKTVGVLSKASSGWAKAPFVPLRWDTSPNYDDENLG